MQMQNDWLFFLAMFLCLLGTMVSVILYIANRNKSLSPRILAYIIFSVSYGLFGYALGTSNQYLNFPHLYRTPVFLSLCIAPLIYLYVRSVLEQQFQFKKYDFLFFVLPVLYTLQFLPFYLLPASDKLRIILLGMEDKSVFAKEPEAMLPAGWGIILRFSYNLAILVATYRLITKWKKKLGHSSEEIEQNKEIFQWLIFLVVVLFVGYFVLIGQNMFTIFTSKDVFRAMALTVSLAVVSICFYLLIKPNILYGLKGWWQEPVSEPVRQDPEPGIEAMAEKGSKTRVTLSLEQRQLFKQRTEAYLRAHAPFVKPGYTIGNLADQCGIPTYQLSAFINQEYEKNFNEFINDWRVDHLVEKVRTSPEYLQYTLEALGQQVGFQSRTAFISAVKRRTGKTPSEFFSRKAGIAVQF